MGLQLDQEDADTLTRGEIALALQTLPRFQECIVVNCFMDHYNASKEPWEGDLGRALSYSSIRHLILEHMRKTRHNVNHDDRKAGVMGEPDSSIHAQYRTVFKDLKVVMEYIEHTADRAEAWRDQLDNGVSMPRPLSYGAPFVPIVPGEF